MSYPSPDENRIILHGRLLWLPVPSHRNHDQEFSKFQLAVCRLSGTEDRINVVVPSSALDVLGPLIQGEELTVQGEIRTYNNRSGVGQRLVISVFARALERCSGEDVNQLQLSGTLCKPPIVRTTPLGRSICDMILAVNRRYGRADYLPCIAWGSLAHRCGMQRVGERMSLDGRLQSRAYTKVLQQGSEERTAFEVSVMEIRETQTGEEPIKCGGIVSPPAPAGEIRHPCHPEHEARPSLPYDA